MPDTADDTAARLPPGDAPPAEGASPWGRIRDRLAGAPSASAAEADPLPPEGTFPGYTVTERVARGGTAEVYRARDEKLDRDVAIKALRADLHARPDAVELFFNEARNVARLRHPNLVRGLDVGRAGPVFYFVMEYVAGESLAAKLHRLQRGRVGEAEALRIVLRVAEALQCVFENGLVHRDVKPGNILLGTDGSVRLCDLGIAREVAFPTDEAAVRASPGTASPEQARGDPDVDIRADLYGLGCTWFHMLTGAPPFAAETPGAVLRKQVEEEPPALRQLDPRLSAATAEAVGRLLRKDRDERPRTPQALLALLAEHPLHDEVASSDKET